jgi:hypothetical protein
VVFVFDFADKFLESDGAILFFHLDNLRVFKEIRSYLKSINFQIQMKWAMLTFYHLLAQESPPWKY